MQLEKYDSTAAQEAHSVRCYWSAVSEVIPLPTHQRNERRTDVSDGKKYEGEKDKVIEKAS